MEVEAAVREALEVQVLEHEPGQAALTLRDAVAMLGAEADPVVADLGAERALFGAWLALLSIVRIVAISLERSEVDVTEEIVSALGTQ